MTVFANGLEVSCKAQGNKIIAATPDTCMTPPENPATPPGVPVPYPSFGQDSDTENGTGTVLIGGKTVSQKNISYYGKTTGTEAGSAAKKGVITSTNTGKAYAAAWSNNVKAEGEPVARFSDRATVNHASPTANDGNGVLVGEAGASDDEGIDDDCAVVSRQIDEMAVEVNSRLEQLMFDEHDLYNTARTLADNWGKGSWEGHINRYESERQQLRGMIALADSIPCPVSDFARNVADVEPPNEPFW